MTRCQYGLHSWRCVLHSEHQSFSDIRSQHVFYNKDPRRLQPLVDGIIEEFKTVDFHGESTFDMIQVLYFFRAFYEQLGMKFTPWVEDALQRCWTELKCEHEDVSVNRACIDARCVEVVFAGFGVFQRDICVLREDHGRQRARVGLTQC